MVRVDQHRCHVRLDGDVVAVEYAPSFPSPRTERISPGHLVALAADARGRDVVVWRWYDAVVVGEVTGGVRLWEPAHGEVLATPRDPDRPRPPGTRAYASAGLPGADWWIAGPTVERPEDADVELTEVGRFVTEHGVLDAAGTSAGRGPADEYDGPAGSHPV